MSIVFDALVTSVMEPPLQNIKSVQLCNAIDMRATAFFVTPTFVMDLFSRSGRRQMLLQMCG